MVAFVNHFIVNTVTFLNKFIGNCETKFIAFESKLQKLEASLLIVEAKVHTKIFQSVIPSSTKFASEYSANFIPPIDLLAIH